MYFKMIVIKYICLSLFAILVAGFVITYGKELIHNPAPSWEHMFDKYIVSLWTLSTSFGHLMSVITIIGILFAFYKGIVTMYADGTTTIKKIEEALTPRLPELKIIYESDASKHAPPPILEPIQLRPVVQETVPHISVEEIKQMIREQLNNAQRDDVSVEFVEPVHPRTRARARSRY
jgi:hypothetical protein